MKRKGALLLAVLLSLMVVFGGCAGRGADMSLLGITGTDYPVFLDQRRTYGRTESEVKAVLGEAEGSWKDYESLPMTILYYTWLFEGWEAELDLGFPSLLGKGTLCSVELCVYCDEGEEKEIVTALEELLEETYGDLSGFSVGSMNPDGSDGFDSRFFGTDLGDTGVTGYIMALPGTVHLTCMAG